MDDPLESPANTREFVAMWNAVTAEHLAHKLAAALIQLSERLPGVDALPEAQASALAPPLVRALQVAASPEGGVHAAVQLLAELAAADPQ